MKLQIMKKRLLLLSGMFLLALHPAQAQFSGPATITTLPPPPDLVGRGEEENKSLPRFDLYFPGGTPGELVKAIEKATYRRDPAKAFSGGGPPPEKPVNVIIPDDCANLKIPGISVKNVNVAQLFEAITAASRNTLHYANGASVLVASYGFRTEGRPDENSIWSFYWDKLVDSSAPAVCRFYQLSSYLEAGYKVEDITTAIETAWKMLGITKPPEIKYHKDTKLLIAVGEEDKLNMIDDALKQLSKAAPNRKPFSQATDPRKPQ